MFTTPILYIVFNRLDTVKQTFPKIREVQPQQLFIAADGPRKDRLGEEKKCKAVREWVLSQIDWDCKVHTLFRDENLGCGKAVSKAITWFFDNVEQGIILEDDCLPSKSFFRYCETLLNYYKNDTRIMHIAGDNPLVKTNCGEASYYFASVQHCWGWASWSRAWKLYDFNIKNDFIQNFKNNKYFCNFNVQKYWTEILSLMQEHKIDTWDYQWTWAILKNNGICINPALNQITNIGCTSDSTHFSDSCDKNLFERTRYELCEIHHPSVIKIDRGLQKKLNKKLGIQYKTFFDMLTEFTITSLKKVLKYIGLFHFFKRLIKGTAL